MNNNFHMREGKVEFRWKRWRNKKRQEVSSCLMVLFSGVVLLGAGGVALAGPTGGQITGGQGTITTPNGTTTNINQQSNVLNINWQDFSIGANETVNFYQPGSTSVAINRVIGGVPSYLAGALNANGRVFILNSAGITFTGTSQVNVGALLATTAMTVNGDPTQAASYSGTGYGAVINQGSISVSNGGFAILAAPYVQNTGFIKADLGTIALAGTNQFTLDLSGTGLINFVVPAGAVEQIVSDGKAVGVDNSGTLQARSGQVVISANVASEVINAVVNLNGIVDADAFAPNGQGGAVLVTAAGDINVGGHVTARGDGAGAGGQIVTKAVGADNIEQMAFVSAVGGATGKGGFIEVSGKTVGLNGSIDPGKGGLLYIDPATFTIKNATSGQGTNFIGEHKLEALLQNGAGFSVAAAGNITIQDLTDNVLAGGSGDLTLHAGNSGVGAIIVQGVNDIIRTGSGDVTLIAAGNIGDAGHRLSFVSGTGLPGVSQAGDILLQATNGGSIFVNTVTVKSAGNSHFHALFSANAANSFNAAGLIDVEARASGFGAQTADAEIHINAGNHIQLHGITDRATAFKNGDGGSNVLATASVTLNGTQLHDTGVMAVTANVLGHAATSFIAHADLEITGAGNVSVTGGSINVNAKASAFSASNVFADATAFIDPITLGPIALDSVHVHANVQALTVASVQAHANFTATGSQISIANDATVTATANNANLGRTASANAHLFLTAAIGNASVHGNVGVTALALDGGGSQDADASASLGIQANKAIDVGGNVTVIANAQTLLLSGSDLSTPNACAIASIHANSGGIHIHGGLDVEAIDSSLNSDSVIARARARLITSNNTHSIDSAVLGRGGIEVDGPTKVIATAKTNAQNVFANGPHTNFGAFASASLLVHAEGHVQMDAVTVKASASDLGRFQANAIAHANIISRDSGISISGSVDVEANAQDPFGNYASANAEANIQASGDIDVLGNVEVNATAQQTSGGTSSGGAFACANLHIVASSSSEGVTDVNVNGNIGVHALAETNGSGTATANAEVLLSAGGGSGGDVTVNGSIDVTATANQVSNTGEGAQACANLEIVASSHFSSAAVINVNGDITVDAFARSNGTGNVTANAQAAIGGDGNDQEDGSSSTNFGTTVNVTVNGNIDVSATANHAGSGAGAALAIANLDIDATSGSVNVNGNIGVHANAQTNGTGGSVFNAFGSSSSNSYGAAAVARAEIAAEATTSAHVVRGSNAFDVTVNGNVEVTAIANQLNTSAGDGALACAALDMDAKFSFGIVNVAGDVTVNALAKDMGTGSAHANAFAGIDAEGSVLIHGNVGVNASAEQLNTGGSSARACANLQMSASFNYVNVNGDVGAHANALASGTESAHANTRVNILGWNGIDITGNVAALASANQHGTGGSSAHACANLQLVAGSSDHAADVNVNGDVTGSANAFSRGSESAIANAFVNIQADAGDVIVNGVVTANANALASSTRGFSGARANASMSIVGDPVTLGGIVDHATADSHGNQFANAQANVHVTGADVEIDGDVSVIANAQTDGSGATGARANAQVFIHASGTSSIDQLTITGSVNVLASASDLHTVTSHANALANVSLTAAGNGIQAALDLGDVRVIANALDHNGVLLTLANAQVLISASNAAHGGVQMGSLDVTASANEVAGTNNAHASAVANALLNAVNVVRTTGSDVLVTANAFDGSGANASATLNVNAGHVVLGSLGGFDSDAGPIGARALAVANGAIAKAKALANVQINAGTGNASIFGVLEAVATASYNHPGGNALANTIASGLANVFACDNISADEINVSAIANNHGNKSAQALASLNFNAGGSITIEETDIVSATADNFSSHGASGGGATGALANAQAHFNGTKIFGTSESSQTITVRAHAINAGHNAAKALALLDFGAANVVNLDGITLDVLASDLRANDNGAGASANAALVQTNGLVHWFIGTHGLNVQAAAHSHGTNVANAHASIDILQNTITIEGPVTVNAEASAGADAHGALAIANLLLNATTGALSVGDGFGSERDILVKANAHNLGHNHANAQADASLLGNTSVYTENVEVDALAFDSQANGGADTKANAQLLASADNGPLSMGSIGVLALADRVNGSDNANGAVAIANAHLLASDFVFTEGGIAVLAVAQDPGGAYANASAELLASANRVIIERSSNQAPIFSSGSIQVNLAANYGVLVGAVAIFSNSLGVGHALADANANIVAHTGEVNLTGAADVFGVALDQGGTFANADADLLVNANTFANVGSGFLQLNVANDSGVFANLTINEGVFVAGVAIDTANGFVDAGADASFLANHNNVSIDHGVDELAIGITDNGTHANAQAHLLVNAGSNTVITGGSISANLFSGHVSLGSLLGGSQIGVLQAAVAVDGGAGSTHHANALAETNIDPNLVQINGDVVVVAAAIDNSGSGATANANLFIHANHVAIGTESGHANVIVAAIAVESGTGGASVNAQANARIIANNASSGAVSINDITVFASAENPSANSALLNESAIAHMLLQASNGGVRVDDVNVAAAASLQGSVSANALASASAVIRAKKNINVFGDITVSALSNTVSSGGDADAFAILKLKTTGSTGSIDVQGHILVNAVAEGGGVSSAIANATANIQGNAGVTLHSGVDVEANADETNSSGTSALACANLDIDAASGSVTINGSAVANAQARTEGDSGNASAYALAEIEAFSGDVNVTGNIAVTANARESNSSSDARGAHANANLAIAALGSGSQSINLTGNITVNAQAQGNGGSSENTGDSVTANAEAQIGGGGNPEDITINGNIVVAANALYSGESGSQDALANANLDIDATSGALVMRGNVLVNAVAEEDGSGSALANAQAELAAENNGSGGGSGSVNVVGNITVLANADVDNSSSGDGAHACANLAILASSGNITLTGNIGVDARAEGNGNSGSSDSVTAQANAQIGGLESGFAGGSDNVFIRGNIAVTAEASYTGDSEVEALACANLDIDGSSGQVSIIGNVTVDASALDEGSGSAIAHATAEIGAENAGSHFDTDVTIIGNIAMRANAQKTGRDSGIASANANLTIVSDDGNVFITGGINASATAFDQGSGNASAFACVAITASHSIVMSGGDIITRAKATYAFSTDAAAVASDAISVHARNVALRGVRGSATAQVSSESAADAQAVTNIAISAGSNISIGPDGVLGFAGATAGSDNGRASANVQMALDAGTNSAGNIFVRGNVIAVAGAFGGGTNNVAHANAHMAAGGATSSSDGPPSHFGNIAVIGNIGAFAFADATNDEATASVEIFAHNNLLIVGNDPIASAHVGPSGGTVFAFRQAHFTTHDGPNSGPGGTALADIDIRAGGFVAVFPTSSLSHVEKLYSLPTDDPTLNSSLGLTIIPLSVDGEDCGVLGIAGKDQAAINKALACHHKPINVSDLTDTGP